jgi:AraC-like DNA-binding protein
VPEWLEQIRVRLMDEYRKRPRRAELARIAGVDPAYMSRAFRHHYGITMTEYARRQRLSQAQWLLARSNDSIAEIASRCGYSDQGHLARELRRITGMTPAAWRRAAWARAIVRSELPHS